VYEDHVTRVNFMVFNFTETYEYISVLNMTRFCLSGYSSIFPLGNGPVFFPFLVNENGLAATVYRFNENVM